MTRAALPANALIKLFNGVAKLFPRKYRWIIGLAALILLLAAFLLQPQAPSTSNPNDSASAQDLPAGYYPVVKVADGDTFSVQRGSQEFTIRLIGVDTPEVVDPRRPVQCFGQEASTKLKQLLTNQSVRLEADPTQANSDSYGRWLRYAYLSNGTNLNLLLIQQGYAYEYTYRSIPYQKQLEYKAAQQLARSQEVGLWNPTVCPP